MDECQKYAEQYSTTVKVIFSVMSNLMGIVNIFYKFLRNFVLSVGCTTLNSSVSCIKHYSTLPFLTVSSLPLLSQWPLSTNTYPVVSFLPKISSQFLLSFGYPCSRCQEMKLSDHRSSITSFLKSVLFSLKGKPCDSPTSSGPLFTIHANNGYFYSLWWVSLIGLRLI